jgi:hypothetical protein
VCGYVFWSVEAELLLVGSSFLYLGEFTCSWAYIPVEAALFPCGAACYPVGRVSHLPGCVLFMFGAAWRAGNEL